MITSCDHIIGYRLRWVQPIRYVEFERKKVEMRNLILMALILVSCKSELRILNQKESQNLVLNGDKKYLFAEYVNNNFLPLSEAEKKKLNQNKLYRTFLINKEGDVEKVIVNEIKNYEEQINELILVNFTDGNPIGEYTDNDIDCASLNIDSISHSAFMKDQDVRSKEITSNQMIEIDDINQDEIVPILINCGWPANSSNVNQLWYIIQHSNIGLQCYFFEDFANLKNEGLLADSLYAKTVDRILTRSGIPQIYGTQSSGGREIKSFHPIQDVENVNKRRKEIGLCPIEQKAKSWGFEFKIEDYLENE